jgi:hypothetical protein
MKTSKSPRRVLQVAYAEAREALSPYAHHFSPKKFTQHQLFACLALKDFLKLDYRGVWQLLLDTPDLCAVIELTTVPHWTTLQKAADRLLKKTPQTASWVRRCKRLAAPESSAAGRAKGRSTAPASSRCT